MRIEYKVGQILRNPNGNDIELVEIYSDELFEYRFVNGYEGDGRCFCNRAYLIECEAIK